MSESETATATATKTPSTTSTSSVLAWLAAALTQASTDSARRASNLPRGPITVGVPIPRLETDQRDHVGVAGSFARTLRA